MHLHDFSHSLCRTSRTFEAHPSLSLYRGDLHHRMKSIDLLLFFLIFPIFYSLIIDFSISDFILKDEFDFIDNFLMYIVCSNREYFSELWPMTKNSTDFLLALQIILVRIRFHRKSLCNNVGSFRDGKRTKFRPTVRPTERTRPSDRKLRTAIPRLIIQYQMSYHSNYRLFLRI